MNQTILNFNKFSKKIAILCFAIMVSSFSSLWAQTTPIGSSGTSWEIRSDSLLITGSDSIPNFADASEQPWNASINDITYIEIEESIVHIGDYAFWGFDTLELILFPQSLTSIGNNAFYGCEKLEYVDIPAALEVIGDSVFYNCEALIGIVLPNNLHTIGNAAFANCVSLATIALPDKITTIEDALFYNCNQLTAVRLSDSLESIGEEAFASCGNLLSITLPAKIISIGNNAFKDCDTLGLVVNLSLTPQVIDASVFSNIAPNCTLKVYAEAVEDYQDSTVWKDFDPIVAINITWYVSSTNDTLYIEGSGPMEDFLGYSEETGFFDIPWHFYRSDIKHIQIEDSITHIGSYTFSNFANVKTVHLPDSLISIGRSAFSGCDSLEKIVFPKKLTSIESVSFYNCVSLDSIVLPDALVQLEAQAFQSCSSLVSAILPDHLTSIEESVFDGCVNLKSVKLPLELLAIENYAFSNCDSLKVINFPEKITSIGNYAFQNCVNLPSITLPDSLTSLGEQVFANCSSLLTITLPYKLSSIGTYAFENCVGLTTVTNHSLTPQDVDGLNIFKDIATTLCTLIVPSMSISTYATASTWEEFILVGMCNVEVNPNDVDYGTVSGSGMFLTTEDDTLRATPNAGHIFVAWENNNNEVLSTANPFAFRPAHDTVITGVFREKNTDATLKSLAADNTTLAPDFHKDTLTYRITVVYDTASMRFSAQTTDTNASIAGGVVDVLHTLKVGDSTFTITVTAEDGTTQKIYNIIVTRLSNTNATLQNLTISEGTLTPAFDKDSLNYTATVSYSVTDIDIFAQTTDANASIAGDTGTRSLSVVGNNMFTITVTAADGVTQLAYNITVTRLSNIDATLQSLIINNVTFAPTFHKDSLNYTATVPYETSDVLIEAIATDVNDATVMGDTGTRALQVGDNLFTITVTAADGIASLEYEITITREPNADATLKDLNVSAGSLAPAFHKDSMTYKVEVMYAISNIEISAQATDINATILGDTGTHALLVGDTTFTITVTAEDNTTKLDYKIIVTRLPNTDATLDSLSISNGTLTPAFDKDALDYTVTINYAVENISIFARATDENASITGDIGLHTMPVGDSTFTITVTAADGTTQLKYNITVTRLSNTDATLSSLTVNNGALTPEFKKDILNYTVSVPRQVSSITLTALLADTDASLEGDTGTHALAVGEQTFTIKVTATNGINTQTYKVVVTRLLGVDAALQNLAVSSGTLSPTFDKDSLDYVLVLPYNVPSITISAQTNDANATMIGDVGEHALEIGEQSFTISVTAEDNYTKRDYTITVTRLKSTDATLKSLVISSGTLSPSFHPDSLWYEVSVPYEVSSVDLTATPNDTTAVMRGGSGTIPLGVGGNTISILITAQDEITSRTYTVIITREKENDIVSHSSESIRIYPNPVINELIIENYEAGTKEVYLYDISGKLLQAIPTTGETLRINTTDLPKGVYVIKAGNISRQIIKE